MRWLGSVASSVLISLATMVASPTTPAAEVMQPGLELRSHLPKDPVMVFVMTSNDLPKSLDEFFENLARFSDAESADAVRGSLSEWERRMGFSLRDDLLAQVGPEFALVIDLPTPEEMMQAIGNPTPESWSRLFRGVGKLAMVRDAARLDDTLRKIFTAWEAKISQVDELTRVAFTFGEPADAAAGTEPALPEISLYYGFRGNTFALGFSPDWVRASLGDRAVGERLDDGEDFAKLVRQLDARPTGLLYVNLPKIADWIRQSPLVSMAIAGDAEAKRMADVFLAEEYVGMGLAATTIETDGGVRTTSFGPSGLSAGRLIRGAMAAIAIPNFLSALDRGKQNRTVADVRSLGIVFEAYFADHGSYPGPTEGWVAVETIAEQVEPIYIRELPREDGWGAPFLVWSDGSTYRIVSNGKDGAMDQDWSHPFDPHETVDVGQDIIFGGGEFLAWPEGMNE